jgi:hypothetical protein
VHTAIEADWTFGIEEEEERNTVTEIILKREPWKNNTFMPRAFMCKLFEEMKSNGGEFRASITSHFARADKDTLYFTQCCPNPFLKVMALQLTLGNTMRLTNIPNGLKNGFADIVRNNFSKRIKEVNDYSNSYEVKVNGRPFSNFKHIQKKDGDIGRILVAAIFSYLRLNGWIVFCSLDTSAEYIVISDLALKHTIPGEKDTIFLYYDRY